MKLLPLLSMLILLHTAQAQIKVTKINVKTLPKSIHYIGDTVINAVRYTDKDGEHIVITTASETAKDIGNGEKSQDADLYAYHYKVNGKQFKLTWQMHDFVKQCEFAIYADFLPGTFAVTDLNHDGRAEVWLMYKVDCRSDVSPATMKIIMHGGDKKYAVRGNSRVRINDTDYVGGDYKFDDAFNKGQEPFRKYALQLWKKNVLETFK
jgi:hypothetical protein